MTNRVAGAQEREFLMTYAHFKKIKALAYEHTGINLSDHKQNMVYGRLARRLRALALTNFDDYIALLNDPQAPELAEFTNAITTNLTSFFRENHHFDFLKSTVIPELMHKNNARRRIRIWSAGCSTGEEPYSIALTLATFAGLRTWDVKILATDLDSNVVATAAAGVYASERIENVPQSYLKSFRKDRSGEFVKVKDEVRKLITFKQLNLLRDWPMKGPFDVIFCRNVVIYFDVPTQKVLFDRYAEMLTSDGHLFIGHSENLLKVNDRFDSLGRTIYRRRK